MEAEGEQRVQGMLGVVSIPSACPGLTGAVHLLPCCITHNGPAPVSDFFVPTPHGTTEDGCQVRKAALRGRKLLGSTVDIPKNYSGLVLRKAEARGTSGMDGQVGKCDYWEAEAIFHNLTYWNHDTMPSSTDSVRRTLEWLSLAPIIHGSISAEEVAAVAQEISKGTAGLKRKLTSTLVSSTS